MCKTTETTVFETEFTHEGATYEVELRVDPPRPMWDRRPEKNARAFVWLKELNVVEDLQERADGSRYERERRVAERRLLDAALALIPFVGGAPASYSRKAGCSCGCSPGFVLKTLPRGATVFVTTKKAEARAA